ncbi:MAG: Protein HflC, partial [Pseudomonadota bacterium]
MKKITYVAVGFLIAIMMLAASTFTVDQREHAIVFRLGEIVSIKKEPGLYFKTPLIENVRFFDNRILTLNVQEADRFI